MEVVAATPNSGGVPPFHNHDVREWSRIDSLTGVLERARLETDHWTANTNNSSHKYGKVVDSRARSDADGAVQQQARRQLEVYQSNVPGGRLQVIKTHTVSSSRWTNKTSSPVETNNVSQDFENLQLSLNQLDLSSQKSKANVGRSVGRRPPSRPRGREEPSATTRQNVPLRDVHVTAATNLHRVSRLCHQIHDSAVKQTFGKYLNKPSIQERESGDGVEIVEIESTNASDCENTKPINGHATLTRTKSTSSEDLHLITSEKDKNNKSIEDLEDLEQLQSWRRTSKIRRSLQFPKQTKPATLKPNDLPNNTGCVRKLREDLETGRRLSTALRGNNVDLEALDQILQSISSSSSTYSDKTSSNCENIELPEKDEQITVKKQKRNSFVTVESLKEVKDRLRRTSSPTDDIYQIKSNKNEISKQINNKEDDADDGIVTEENSATQFSKMPVSDSSLNQSRVRSYVFGMEAMLNKKPMLGTGSLESRTSKQSNGNSGSRNEDWYNRRKSYGFEQVHNQQESASSISLKNKSFVESSTDSGICRSTEIVVTPTINKNGVQTSKTNGYHSENDKDDKCNKTNKYDHLNGVLKSSSLVYDKNGNSNPFSSKKAYEELTNIWNRRASYTESQAETNSDARNGQKDLEGTRITIPIVTPNVSVDNKKSLQHHTSDNKLDNTWYNKYDYDGEVKRHSIAVDESKYVIKNADNNYRRTSLAINDTYSQDGLEDDSGYLGRKPKKVEFCKTEVHFAADSGRVNIVETDEKPPPTNNFRRRRRNSGTIYNQITEDLNKNGVPVLHFGDSTYEKNLLGVAEPENYAPVDSNTDIYPVLDVTSTENDVLANNTVTVNTNQHYQKYQQYLEDEQKDNLDNEAPRGILKNKPIKPRPYLLGADENFLKDVNSNGLDSDIWGVKLKPVHKNETPMWRSTVTLKNILFERQNNDEHLSLNDDSYSEISQPQVEPGQPEFQKLLKTLRSTNKTDNPIENQRNSLNFDGIRIVPPQTDIRNSAWSVADRIKQVEDIQKSESKGYSTKVNIVGDGEATVIENIEQENGKHIWSTRDEPADFTNIRVSGENLQLPSQIMPTAFKKVQSSTTEKVEKWEKPLQNSTQSNTTTKSSITNRNSYSPVVLRKVVHLPKKTDLKTAHNTPTLSSPSLVGQNRSRKDSFDDKPKHVIDSPKVFEAKIDQQCDERLVRNIKNKSPVKQMEKRSPTPTRDDNYQPKTTPVGRQKSPVRLILRTPKKSEMAYFGVKVSPSPKPVRKIISSQENNTWDNKPDLLQHYNTREKQKSRTSKTEVKRQTKSPTRKNQSPIYENIEEIKRYKTKSNNKKEFDSSILDELTKAADQILQAVNGYADENHCTSNDENVKGKSNRKLDTISETKSWKQENASKTKISSSKNDNIKKLKHTSSNSSIESVSERRKALTPTRKSYADNEKYKKKVAGENVSSRAAVTKARRLQRASSREALLQSHGSSSEDLQIAIEVPVRKPRLVKRTKATQLTITNGLEISKQSNSSGKKREERTKSEDRVPVAALPEIRHKTAVSTIRGTAEKAASRERAHRMRHEDARRKVQSRKESSRVVTSPPRSDRSRSASTREVVNHRVSTANIKKCSKPEGVTRH